MRLPLLISLSLLLLPWQRACAQVAPADDFFNSGAQLYISNNIPQAKEETEMGLKLYPDDEKLKKLEQLLNQQQQQQQQQNQQNQQNQPQQQQNQKNNQPQKNQQNQQQQNQQNQQKQSEQQKKEQQQQKASEDRQKAEQNANEQPGEPDKMTPEEARRLLDAQKDNEQVLPLKPEAKPRDESHPVKDW